MTDDSKTIYVITQGSYSDYHIITVFSDEQAAESFAKLISEKGDTATVEDYELDRYVPQAREGLMPFYVWMTRDGNGEVDGSHILYDDRLSLLPTPTPDRIRLRGTVWALDEQHALKIANEKRAFLIASGEWKIEA